MKIYIVCDKELKQKTNMKRKT